MKKNLGRAPLRTGFRPCERSEHNVTTLGQLIEALKGEADKRERSRCIVNLVKCPIWSISANMEQEAGHMGGYLAMWTDIEIIEGISQDIILHDSSEGRHGEPSSEIANGL